MEFGFTPDDRDSESDIEQKIVFPLLSSPEGLDIPIGNIRTKQSIRPYDIGKGEKRRVGFIPDYLIWYDSFPIMVVEVKAPRVAASIAYEEAQLYAHVYNARYATGVNPTSLVIGTNGQEILIGSWDSPPVLQYPILTIASAPRIPQDLYDFCGKHSLEGHARDYARRLRKYSFNRAYYFMGGPPVLRQQVPINSFAVNLSPVLKRYFSSESQFDNDEILTRGYVSTEEITKYDTILETFLRDSMQERTDQWALKLEPTNKHESTLSTNLESYRRKLGSDGHLQLIVGGVGSGKSLFIRRYHRHLVPPSIRRRTRWVFLDFNTAPESTDSIERWVCSQFIDSFQQYNDQIDLYDLSTMEGIFAPMIAKRERSIYARLRVTAPQEFEIERSRDLRMWSDDPEVFVKSICRYFIADRSEIVVVVFDNVDRLGKDEQIRIFSVAQWFKSLTKSYCILQMRDETYERYKDDKPLDTYRTAIKFYIRPPRFIDIIKKRVKLADDFIKRELPKELSYDLEDGKRIVYGREDLAHFLNALYMRIFQAERNSARIVEALAGKDTRRSLETFSRVVSSGHLSHLNITAAAMGGSDSQISEKDIIKILMRTNHKYFSDTSGSIRNIFILDADWVRPSTLLSLELLSFLIERRRTIGQVGLQGYFSIEFLQNSLEDIGFHRDDVYKCADRMIRDGLLVPDQLVIRELTMAHCVKVHASGFIHHRVLCERLEYLYGLLTVFPFRDKARCEKVAKTLLADAPTRAAAQKRIHAVSEMRDQLAADIDHHVKSYSVYRSDLRGSSHTLELIDRTIERETELIARSALPYTPRRQLKSPTRLPHGGGRK